MGVTDVSRPDNCGRLSLWLKKAVKAKNDLFLQLAQFLEHAIVLNEKTTSGLSPQKKRVLQKIVRVLNCRCNAIFCSHSMTLSKKRCAGDWCGSGG